MSLLTRIFARRKASPTPNMDLERRIWHDYYDYGEESEVWWWPEQSLKVAAVWRCVNIVCNALSSIPWRVMRIEEDGRMQDKMHPLHQLLEISPNEEMTPASFRETMISHILLHGNAYAEIVRDNRGYPQEMWLIAPDRVEPRRNEMGRLEYKISQSGGQMVYLKPNEIFHVPGLSFDGIRGYSILDVADRSLSNALRIDKFTSNYFKHAMQPSGVIMLSPDIQATEETIVRIQNAFKRYIGSNGNKPFIADAGTDYRPIQHTPEQAQFLETRLFMIREICRLFGVPPYMVFASDSNPRANVEQQNREFIHQTLMPLGTKIEQEANRKLILFPRRYTTSFDYKEMTRGDMSTRAEWQNKLRMIGVLSVNEIREMEGLESIGKEGDFRVSQVQLQPIDPETGSPAAPPDLSTGQPGQSGEAEKPGQSSENMEAENGAQENQTSDGSDSDTESS